jgi:hypothetical protein
MGLSGKYKIYILVFWVMASLIIVRKQELPKQKHQIRGLPRELSTLRIESNEVYQYPLTRYSLFAQPIKAFFNLNREEPHAMKVAFSNFSTIRPRQHITHFLFDGSAQPKT